MVYFWFTKMLLLLLYCESRLGFSLPFQPWIDVRGDRNWNTSRAFVPLLCSIPKRWPLSSEVKTLHPPWYSRPPMWRLALIPPNPLDVELSDSTSSNRNHYYVRWHSAVAKPVSHAMLLPLCFAAIQFQAFCRHSVRHQSAAIESLSVIRSPVSVRSSPSQPPSRRMGAAWTRQHWLAPKDN